MNREKLKAEITGIVDFTIADARLHNNLEDLSNESVEGLLRVFDKYCNEQPDKPVVGEAVARGGFSALQASPSVPTESGSTPVVGLWKNQSLSRLERVKAHRMEFSSGLSVAIAAVDDETARQELLAREAAVSDAEQSGDLGASANADPHRVYVASRASSADRPAMWRALRDAGRPIISTWIDEAGEGETACNSELWSRIEREVTTANGLIFYAEPDDFPLKGALVEVGMALAARVPVVVVTPGVELQPRSLHPVGSWAMHPLVVFAADVEQAFDLLGRATKATGETQ